MNWPQYVIAGWLLLAFFCSLQKAGKGDGNMSIYVLVVGIHGGLVYALYEGGFWATLGWSP